MSFSERSNLFVGGVRASLSLRWPIFLGLSRSAVFRLNWVDLCRRPFMYWMAQYLGCQPIWWGVVVGNFLLVSENSSDNIVDHAINDGLKSLLGVKGCNYRFVVFASRKISKVGSLHDVSPFFKLKRVILRAKPLFHLIWLLRNRASIKTAWSSEYSGAIIGDGQCFAFPIAMYTWVKYAKERKLPTYLVGGRCAGRGSEIYLYKKAFRITLFSIGISMKSQV